jgi:hypothetical protein
VGSGGGRGGDGWEMEGWAREGRRCMLACEQCDGCATCEVETDNLRCVCSRLLVAKVAQCGRCCLLLHALKLPQKFAVRCCRWWRRGKMRRRRRRSRLAGLGLFLLAGSARFVRMQMLQHIMLLLLLLLRVLIKLPLLHHVALSLLLLELLVRLFKLFLSYAAASTARPLPLLLLLPPPLPLRCNRITLHPLNKTAIQLEFRKEFEPWRRCGA